MHEIGRFLVVLGALALLLGGLFLFADRLPPAARWIGRLPGDIVVRRDRFTFYFPLATSVVVSVVLTLLLNLFWRR
jgi:formate hydrogenlyase subunit 3/multisubunit Na+/H+ antiporter MnhD subunit